MFPDRSNKAAACPPTYQPRSRQPIAAGSRAGSSAGHGSAAAGASWSAASMTPAVPSRSTSVTSSWLSACLTCVAVQPAHHCRSAGAAGPNASSQRRASSARAATARGRLVRRDGPGELAGGPAAAGPPAHDQALGRQQREQPGGDVHRAAVALALGSGVDRSGRAAAARPRRARRRSRGPGRPAPAPRPGPPRPARRPRPRRWLIPAPVWPGPCASARRSGRCRRPGSPASG